MINEQIIFKIKEEQSLLFKCGNVLYISKIFVGECKYLIELSSRKACIGRRKAHCKRVADGLFELVIESYKRFASFEEALKIWKVAFSFELNIEMVFVLRVIKRTFEQAKIGEMMDHYKLTMESEIKEKNEQGFEPMRIELSFPNRSKKIGRFVGHFLQNDFKFELFQT